MAKSNFSWLIEKLKENKKVESTLLLNENILKVVRTGGEPLNICASSLNTFTLKETKELLEKYNADFILHTAREPFIHGSIFDYLDLKESVIGGYGDLFRVINQDYNWPYLPPSVHFITRGLKQHTKVNDVRRLDNKRYEISRHDLETVTIIALDDYDLGIESIRNAVDKYESFDAVLKSNPNGRISTTAIELADSRKIKVFKWGELLGKLNQKWNWKQ
jgi:hypothetical protein